MTSIMGRKERGKDSFPVLPFNKPGRYHGSRCQRWKYLPIGYMVWIKAPHSKILGHPFGSRKQVFDSRFEQLWVCQNDILGISLRETVSFYCSKVRYTRVLRITGGKGWLAITWHLIIIQARRKSRVCMKLCVCVWGASFKQDQASVLRGTLQSR